jgi:hypothetical protein
MNLYKILSLGNLIQDSFRDQLTVSMEVTLINNITDSDYEYVN